MATRLGVWPQQADARALAGSMSVQTHAAFTALRSACPMNLGKRYASRDRGTDCAADAARICQLWRKARETLGRHSREPFRFCAFSAADALYAPVVTRLDTYAIRVPADARAYLDVILGTAAFCKFRHLLERHQLADAFLAEINAELSARGLLLKQGTVVDAKLIAAPPSTKNEARKRDPEMSSTKKGNQ